MTRPLGPRKPLPVRNRYFFIADVLLIPLAVVISFLLRLETARLQPYAHTILIFAALAAIAKPLIFYLFGLYRRYWRYASANELANIALATLTGTAVTTLLMYSLASLFWEFSSLPRSIPFLDWLVSLLFVGGTRFAVRLAADVSSRSWRKGHPKDGRYRERRVLVMGAGDAGAMIVREMQANPGLGYIPIGLLDDNRAKVGMEIHGVPVLGTREDIPWLAQKERVDEVIIAMPTAPGRAIREVVAICQEAGVACKTIPGIYEMIASHVSIKQVREVRVEDLLRREPVRMGMEGERFLCNAVVLVTGAGGSIGAELCRQIALYRPAQLLLLGHGENSIYHILLELSTKFPYLAVQPLIADVCDCDRLKALFACYKPEIVFHAAAHKHVPLMEANVAETVRNNVFGTLNLLRVAEANDVKRFVLISTDKAVNPANVMGATKRLAELLVQDAARRTGRAFVAVRFGNVLGSRSSVIPLFQQQIAAGGPVTVTHPEMQRYFMTIPEAAYLVIRAAALGQGGEIFVLDMGPPVRIVDLAAELIRLYGLEPGRDIEIVFTGPRPGEKLSEMLFADGEILYPTQCEKILVVRGNNTWDSETLSHHLRELEIYMRTGDAERIRAKMQEIVPEYTPFPVTSYVDRGGS